MENMKIRKQDSNIVPCVIRIPENPKGIVIAIHGFSSSKECATYKMLLRRLPEAGYGMFGIELPGHGKEEALQETLRIQGCMDSIEATEKTISETFPGTEIFYFCFKFRSLYNRVIYQHKRASWKKSIFPECGRQYAIIIRQKESK